MVDWHPAVAGGDGEVAGLPPFAQPRDERRSLVRELPLLIGAAIVIAFVLKSFVAQAFFIPSESMVPQLRVGDRVVVSKISYRLHDPRRGDVVVFDAPLRSAPTDDDSDPLVIRALRSLLEALGLRHPSTEDYIKRVVGLPGETVEGKDGKVFVNGRELLEPYLPPGTVVSDFPPTEVPAGRLFVMGDNRGHSQDSRVFGPIPESTVVGRAILRAWPPGRAAFL